MLQLAIITPNQITAEGIRQVAEESGILQVVYVASPIPTTGEVARSLQTYQPDVVLLDVGEWQSVATLAERIHDIPPHGVVVGFRPRTMRGDVQAIEDAGIRELLPEPFSPEQLQAKLYDAVHRKRPIHHQNILAFLPAKAGSGSSTVALHTAAALAHRHPRKVLLLEADRRSGVLSILLNLPNRAGLNEVLKEVHQLTELGWTDSVHRIGGLDILPSNPFRRGLTPSWADYFQLFLFVQRRYEYIVVDMPEVVNAATAEVVRNASSIFIVCTPELPSLTMAGLRSGELDACEIPDSKVQVIVNRFEKGRLSKKETEDILRRTVYATVPNDYRELKDAISESHLASSNSSFGRGCQELAERLAARNAVQPEPSRFALFRKLSLMTE